MGRNPYPKEGLNRGTWTAHEDELLREYVRNHGEGKWGKVFKETDLKRCGKSCRLRWLNYLRPNIKRGNITQDEEDLIIRLHRLLGNRWSLIAGRLPGRTDNEIKNYWNSTLRKKLVQDTHNSKRQNIKETEPINTSPTMVKAQLEDSNNTTTTRVQASMIQGTLPAAKHVTEQTYLDDKLNFLSNCDNGNDDSWDFMVELNGEQFRLSDFLHADFSNPSPSSSSSSERAALFSEAMLKNLSTEDTIQTEYDFDP